MLSLAACGTKAASPSDNGADNSPPVSPFSATTSAADPTQAGSTTAAGGQTIKLTLEGDEGTQEITATLMDTPAAEFAGHMPFTVDYEIGDIIYYPAGPTYAMYYGHDGRTIAAGMEVITRMDQEGIDALGSYTGDVEVTVALIE